MPRRRQKAPKFANVLAHLQDVSQPFPMQDLYQLSDLAEADLAALTQVWPGVPTERRRSLLEDLSEVSEANYEVAFDDVFRLAMHDEDAQVRALAVRGLWETEDPELIVPLIDLLRHDPAEAVRAAAASTLGHYVYLGEVEEITAEELAQTEEALLQAWQGTDALEVRRRALEAIAFSSRPEIPNFIEAAYDSAEAKMRVSALFAMGRSADNRWAAQVIDNLEQVDPELRFEAARAAGELELSEAVTELAELTHDVDGDVRDAAIWSLGQVGGEEARDILTELLERAQEDGDEAQEEFLESALENLDFTDNVQKFSLFDFDEDDADAAWPDDLDSPPPPNSKLRQN